MQIHSQKQPLAILGLDATTNAFDHSPKLGSIPSCITYFKPQFQQIPNSYDYISLDHDKHNFRIYRSTRQHIQEIYLQPNHFQFLKQQLFLSQANNNQHATFAYVRSHDRNLPTISDPS
jgi:hypothetical protein